MVLTFVFGALGAAQGAPIRHAEQGFRIQCAAVVMAV